MLSSITRCANLGQGFARTFQGPLVLAPPTSQTAHAGGTFGVAVRSQRMSSLYRTGYDQLEATNFAAVYWTEGPYTRGPAGHQVNNGDMAPCFLRCSSIKPSAHSAACDS